MNAEQRDMARLELYEKAMSEIEACGPVSENFNMPRAIRMGVTNRIAHNIRVHMDDVNLSMEEKRALDIVRIAKESATSPQVLIDAARFYLSDGSRVFDSQKQQQNPLVIDATCASKSEYQLYKEGVIGPGVPHFIKRKVLRWDRVRVYGIDFKVSDYFTDDTVDLFVGGGDVFLVDLVALKAEKLELLYPECRLFAADRSCKVENIAVPGSEQRDIYSEADILKVLQSRPGRHHSFHERHRNARGKGTLRRTGTEPAEC